jgi:hypothetical protein
LAKYVRLRESHSALCVNISDPVQSASLSADIQGEWGSTIYDAYGFYTSYNGALAAWAMLAGKY